MAVLHIKKVIPIPTPYQFNPNPVTIADTGNVHVTLLNPEVTQPEPPLDRHVVQDRNKTNSNSNGTQRLRPPYRRRRPPYRRIRPGSSSKNIPLPSSDRKQVNISQFSTSSVGQESTKSKNVDSSQMLYSNKSRPGNSKQSSGSTNYTLSTEKIETPATPLILPMEEPAFINANSTINPVEDSHEAQTFMPSTKPPVATQMETTTPLLNNRVRVSQPPSQERKQWDRNKEDSISSVDKKSPWVPTTKNSSLVQRKTQTALTPASSTVTHSLITSVTVRLAKPVLSKEEVQLANVSPAVPIQNTAQTYIQPNGEMETKSRAPGSSSRNPTYRSRLRDSLPKLPNRQKENSSKTITENPNPPIVPAHHPWVIQQQAQKKLNMPNTQTPSTYNFARANLNLFPARPSVQGSRHYPSFPSRPWHFHYTRERDAGVTNRPEITALTAKPTASIPGAASPGQVTGTPQTLHTPPLNTFPNRTKDLSFLSRLRNRYRQSQLDAFRVSQLGKTITQKPKVNPPFPKFQKPPTLLKAHSPVTPASVPSAANRPPSTPSILYGSRLHVSHRGPKTLNTALPFPELMGSGERPRITSVNIVSMSALAEADVFLPCESSGEPVPTLSWTKVSTGGYCSRI